MYAALTTNARNSGPSGAKMSRTAYRSATVSPRTGPFTGESRRRGRACSRARRARPPDGGRRSGALKATAPAAAIVICCQLAPTIERSPRQSGRIRPAVGPGPAESPGRRPPRAATIRAWRSARSASARSTSLPTSWSFAVWARSTRSPAPRRRFAGIGVAATASLPPTCSTRSPAVPRKTRASREIRCARSGRRALELVRAPVLEDVSHGSRPALDS